MSQNSDFHEQLLATLAGLTSALNRLVFVGGAAAQEVLTPREAAKLLGIDEDSLKRYRSTGEGPPYFRMPGALNGSVRYRRASLEKWMADRERRSTAEETQGRREGR